MNGANLLKEVLGVSVKENASDIHFSVGHLPTLRVDRDLIPLEKYKQLTEKDISDLIMPELNDEQKERLLREKGLEFSYLLEDKIRFRTSVFFQRGGLSVVMRLIQPKIRTIEELNLPNLLHDFAKASQGFVLVTGPSSHGKSTTLAAIVDEINHDRPVHIITIEDPIEYYFDDDKAIIDQREVGFDTVSFADALRASFRQDPDVLMVGEMRDAETMMTAITAAETGHLVFSTLHTNSASQSIHRMVDSFPPVQQAQVRAQLSSSLLGVISQRLIPRVKGGLIPACEIMVSTPAVANLIREGKTHEIPMVIETSAEAGMITLNKSLAKLVRAKEISIKTAIKFSGNQLELSKLIGGL